MITRSTPARGCCYGFKVCSELPFDFLRSGGGVPLAIDEQACPEHPAGELIQSWSEIPGKRMPVRLYQSPKAFTVIAGSDHCFRVELVEDSRGQTRAARIAVSPSRMPQARELLLWTTPAAVAIVTRGDLALHASAVEANGHAILLTGPSGAGKTTTAAAFYASGYRVLADDLTCCAEVSARPVILPGPAVLRVHAEVATRVLEVADQKSNAAGRKFAFSFPSHRRGTGAGVPLGAIVVLAHNESGAHIERLSPAQALGILWPANFYLPTDEHRARTFQRLGEILAAVPVWQLSRPLEWDGLPALVKRITAVTIQ